jgi:hypothetical protein
MNLIQPVHIDQDSPRLPDGRARCAASTEPDSPDDGDDVVTADDVIEAYGLDFYETALSQGGYHTDLRNRPCWPAEEWPMIEALTMYALGGDDWR